MAKLRKSSSVPGQALGFSLQFTKMTELLARAPAGSEVEFEGIDDLTVLQPDGNRTICQAKSALESNPLTDRAVALWKALANWAEAIRTHTLDYRKLKLVFYVSNPVRPGTWAKQFDAARSEAEVDGALESVRTALWGVPPDFPLRKSVAADLSPHVERFFGAPESIRRAVIHCFALEVVNNDIHHDLAAIVRFVDPKRHSEVLHHACAWTKQRVDQLIGQRKPARILVDEFTQEMIAYIRKFNERAILRSFAPAGPSASEAEQLKLRKFVRQLELIELDYSDQLQAISDFYRAAIDRTKWGESGEVHPTSFDALDEALHRSWKNISRQKAITMKANREEERGETVYRECLQQRLSVENQQPPEHFIPGCYHLLADEVKLGWHPRYSELLTPSPSAATS